MGMAIIWGIFTFQSFFVSMKTIVGQMNSADMMGNIFSVIWALNLTFFFYPLWETLRDGPITRNFQNLMTGLFIWTIGLTIQYAAVFSLASVFVTSFFFKEQVVKLACPNGAADPACLMLGYHQFQRIALVLGGLLFLVGVALYIWQRNKGKLNLLDCALLFLAVLGGLALGISQTHLLPYGGKFFELIFIGLFAPFCGVLILRLKISDENELHKDDFEYGGDFKRGVKLLKQEKSSKGMKILCEKELAGGRKGVSLWGDTSLPFARENQHFLVVGSPGAGKTQIIYPLVNQAFQRGDKVILWDVKGTFIQSFVGQPGVDLLAAWDKRSMSWMPGADIVRPLDCQQIAAIMIPENPRDSQPYFINSARQILEAVLIYLDSQGNSWSWNDVWQTISQDRKKLAAFLLSFPDGKVSGNLLAGDSKAAEDVHSTLLSHANQTIRWYAKAWPNEGVSLRKWIHSDSKMLIIGGLPDRLDIAMPTATAAVQLIVNEILSMPDDINRRVWLVLDELATLGKLEALLQAFSLGRSKGLCVVAGIQDIGRIEHLYGNALAKSISNTFSTAVFLRCSDVETSQWASRVIGEQDVIEEQESVAVSDGPARNIQKILKTRAVFTATEVSHFENLSGVIRLSGWPLFRVQWPYTPIPQKVVLVEDAEWMSKKSVSSNNKSVEQTPPQAQWRLD
jgi:hypothetical protein